ncbi:MAG: methyltransferase domain-containing protein [Phenylobacterium sp.]|uniref:class I SAM-dependent methyltransferase n=1 Tax=Phenylobacterium sp. TaxID=1871053 RepID=UPI001A511478|nr:methyltransferase domain-containing protein [Phenylobacterium sp.]MBL8553910.1 methyltransferase domain-containing protein [Phenylobacterium sp.]
MSEPNAAQAEYWNSGAGPTWAALQRPLDRQLAPLGRAAMAALDPRPGEDILDVGCGAGETVFELARRVTPGGEVTGVDISATLLDAARRRREGAPGVHFVQADAQTHGFAPGSFDGVFSRFGVMFFADPTAAFTNLRHALKSGGRLAFVCWRTPAENPIMTLPMQAALAHLPPPDAPADPTAPGPFAFADAGRLRGILEAAGFTDIAIAPHAEKIGGGDLDASLDLALKVGPLGAMLRQHPDKADAVIGAVREALAPHVGPDGLKLDSATWIVTARAPG